MALHATISVHSQATKTIKLFKALNPIEHVFASNKSLSKGISQFYVAFQELEYTEYRLYLAAWEQDLQLTF